MSRRVRSCGSSCSIWLMASGTARSHRGFVGTVGRGGRPGRFWRPLCRRRDSGTRGSRRARRRRPLDLRPVRCRRGRDDRSGGEELSQRRPRGPAAILAIRPRKSQVRDASADRRGQQVRVSNPGEEPAGVLPRPLGSRMGAGRRAECCRCACSRPRSARTGRAGRCPPAPSRFARRQSGRRPRSTRLRRTSALMVSPSYTRRATGSSGDSRVLRHLPRRRSNRSSRLALERCQGSRSPGRRARRGGLTDRPPVGASLNSSAAGASDPDRQAETDRWMLATSSARVRGRDG